MRKASAYMEKVRMEKLQKELAGLPKREARAAMRDAALNNSSESDK